MSWLFRFCSCFHVLSLYFHVFYFEVHVYCLFTCCFHRLLFFMCRVLIGSCFISYVCSCLPCYFVMYWRIVCCSMLHGPWSMSLFIVKFIVYDLFHVRIECFFVSQFWIFTIVNKRFSSPSFSSSPCKLALELTW